MVYIYVDQISERCVYTFDFLFSDYQIAYKLTNDVPSFSLYEGPKVNYSYRFFEGVETIIPASVLFDETLKPYDIELVEYQQEACFAFDGVVDPFASIFYVVSRMEEYLLVDVRDKHNRFPATKSCLFKFGLLDKLVCDRLCRAIINEWNKKGLLEKPFEALDLTLFPTFDIDHVYAYRLKGFWREVLAKVKDFINGNQQRIEERRKVLSNQMKDPYDTFDLLLKIAEEHPVHLFWLLGNYAKYDRNSSHLNVEHQELIERMAETCMVGIHPSYQSNTSATLLSEEVKRLESILGEKVQLSRQHFLKMHLPYTYQELIRNGIEHDYTMGFAAEVGFRAGTLRAFSWFDLSKNCSTNLTIHPFAYMDGTLLEYKNWSIEEAKSHIQALFEEAKQFGGDFYFLWHNETIGDYGKWKSWKAVLDFTLNLK